MHTHTRAHAHMRAHTHMCACTHMHTHTHVRTHTYAHTHVYIYISNWWFFATFALKMETWHISEAADSQRMVLRTWCPVLHTSLYY